MAADGMTNREIAQALFLTEKTIEVHLTSTLSQARHPLALAAPARSRGNARGEPPVPQRTARSHAAAMKITRFLILIPLVALTAIAGNASAHDNGKSFALTGKTLGPPAQIDLGTPGPSAGDQLIITMDLFKGAKRVGESHVVCTTVRVAEPSIVQCDNVTNINGSQITATGVVTSDEEEQTPFVQAITGGTGAFSGADGQLTVSEAGPQPATLTFQLDN